MPARRLFQMYKEEMLIAKITIMMAAITQSGIEEQNYVDVPVKGEKLKFHVEQVNINYPDSAYSLGLYATM